VQHATPPRQRMTKKHVLDKTNFSEEPPEMCSYLRRGKIVRVIPQIAEVGRCDLAPRAPGLKFVANTQQGPQQQPTLRTKNAAEGHKDVRFDWRPPGRKHVQGDAFGSQYPMQFADRDSVVLDVFEDLIGHDNVETIVIKWKPVRFQRNRHQNSGFTKCLTGSVQLQHNVAALCVETKIAPGPHVVTGSASKVEHPGVGRERTVQLLKYRQFVADAIVDDGWRTQSTYPFCIDVEVAFLSIQPESHLPSRGAAAWTKRPC